MKMRNIGKSEEQISKYIGNLYKVGYQGTLTSDSEVPLDYDLKEALLLASVASQDLKAIGRENLRQIREIIENQDQNPIDIDSPVLRFSDGSYTKDRVTIDSVRCARRVLFTYLTVLKWNKEVEHLRKLNSLERIL